MLSCSSTCIGSLQRPNIGGMVLRNGMGVSELNEYVAVDNRIGTRITNDASQGVKVSDDGTFYELVGGAENISLCVSVATLQSKQIFTTATH